MLTRWRWGLSYLRRQLWFTVAVYSAIGVAVAFAAALLDTFIPSSVSTRIGAEAADRILGILASSMLAVTTFSMATMVQAFASAGQGATPRVTRLLIQDRVAQRALAVFMGSFVFSLVSLIGLSTESYGRSGRLILFAATIAVIIIIVITLLRWIDRLARLGSMDETIGQVERAATAAVIAGREQPLLGGQPAIEPPAAVQTVVADEIGFVEQIDIVALSKVAEEADCDIHVRLRPGGFAAPGIAVALTTATLDDEKLRRVRRAFRISETRSFEQDPRFGLVVLSEIASRALSPAINDPGTAIAILGSAVRILHEWSRPAEERPASDANPRVFIPPIEASDLIEDGFMPIARDGAGIIEVGLFLQKTLYAVSRLEPFPMHAAAVRQARDALERGEAALNHPADQERLRHAARWAQTTT